MDVTPSTHSGPTDAQVNSVFGGGFGEWRQQAGTLELNVTNTMVAGFEYTMAIILHNPMVAKTSLFAALQVEAYPVRNDLDPETFSVPVGSARAYSTATLSNYAAYQIYWYELRPVYIREIDFLLSMVNQSKPFPCALNRINVALMLNVPLLATCKHPMANVYNFTPSVSISGLTGTTSDDDTVIVEGAPFALAASSWTKSSGTLVLTPSFLHETIAGQQYDFSFVVTNQAEGQLAPDVSMAVDTIQPYKATQASYLGGMYLHSHHTSDAFMIEEEVQPLFIRSAGFYSQSTVRQNTSHPCADNLITVVLVVNVPLYARCRTNITVSGLTGTATPDNYFLHAVSAFASSPASLSPKSWDRGTGTLIVSAEGADIDGGLDGVTQISFQYRVENRAEAQAAPLLTVHGSFDKTLTTDGLGGWVDGWDDALNAVEGIKIFLSTITSSATSAQSDSDCFVSFLVHGVWTMEEEHFSSAAQGQQIHTEHLLSSAPSAMMIRLSGTLGTLDDWGFYSIATTSSRGQTQSEFPGILRTVAVSPYGPSGAASSVTPEYWLGDDTGVSQSRTWMLTAASELTSSTGNWSAGTPVQDQYVATTAWGDSQTTASFQTGQDIHEPTTQAHFPGYVQAPHIQYTLAGQSSPWPCDVNTVTVIFQSNVPLLARCKPTLTVSGLQEVQGGGPAGVAAGEIDVNFWNGAFQSHITAPINNVMKRGVFDKSAGTLTVNVTELLNNVYQLGGAQDTLMFTFQVVNRYKNSDGDYLSSGNTLNMQYSFESASIGGLQQTASVDVSGSSRAFLFETHESVTSANSYTIDVDRGFASEDTSTYLNLVHVKLGDAVPLFIRPAYFMVKVPSCTFQFDCV